MLDKFNLKELNFECVFYGMDEFFVEDIVFFFLIKVLMNLCYFFIFVSLDLYYFFVSVVDLVSYVENFKCLK